MVKENNLKKTTKKRAVSKDKITIKDIARQCGTSIATVSRVINGNTAVTPQVRDTVLAHIRSINWQSNSKWNSGENGNQLLLSTQAKQLPYVVMIAPYILKPNLELVSSVAKLSHQCGFEGVYFFGISAQMIELCRCLKPRAIFLISNLGVLREEFADLEKNGSRILYIGSGEIEEHSGSSCYASINEFVRFSVQTLQNLGHKHIGYFGELGEYPRFFGNDHHTNRQNFAISTMKQMLPDFAPERDTVGDCYGDLSHLRERLKHNKNTAWICGTAKLTKQFMQVAKSLMLKIPQDLSVLALTTITPLECMGVEQDNFTRVSINFDLLDVMLQEFVLAEQVTNRQFALPPILVNPDCTIGCPQEY